MAAGFPILFTGGEVNFDVPKFEEMNKAADNLQRKLQVQALEDKELMKEFRDNMNLDLGTLISTHSMQQQADMVKAFEDKWTLALKKNGGKVNNDMLMGMQKDINGMTSRQGQWQQSQKLWEQDKAKVDQAGGEALYDKEKFAKDTEKFMRYGIYEPNSLEYSGVNMGSFFDNVKWQGKTTSSSQTITPDKSGNNIITTTTQNATDPKEAEAFIAQTILSNPRYLKGVQQDFLAQKPEVQMKYLKDYDADGNGKITSDEMGNVDMSGLNIMSNPIVAWAMSPDGYLNRVMRTTIDKETKPMPKATAGRAPTAAELGSITWKSPEGFEVKLNQQERDLWVTDRNKFAATYPELYKEMTGTKDDDGKGGAIDDEIMGRYIAPSIENGAYKYESLDPFVLDKSLRGINQAGKEVKVKSFLKDHGAVSVYSISPSGDIKFMADDKAIIRLKLSDIADKEAILNLKVETADGLKSISDIINDPSLATPVATSASNVTGGETKKPKPY